MVTSTIEGRRLRTAPFGALLILIAIGLFRFGIPQVHVPQSVPITTISPKWKLGSRRIGKSINLEKEQIDTLVKDFSELQRHQVRARVLSSLASEGLEDYKVHVVLQGAPLLSHDDPPKFMGIRIVHLQVSVAVRGQSPPCELEKKLLPIIAKRAGIISKRGDQLSLTVWEHPGPIPWAEPEH